MINIEKHFTREEVKQKLNRKLPLAGLDLRGTNLMGLDFTGIDCEKTDFRAAAIKTTIMQNTKLEGAVFDNIIYNKKNQQYKLKMFAQHLLKGPVKLKNQWELKDKPLKPSFNLEVVFADYVIDYHEAYQLKTIYGRDKTILFLLGQEAYGYIYHSKKNILNWLSRITN